MNSTIMHILRATPRLRRYKQTKDPCLLVIPRADVCRSLKRINTHKAPGHDGISGRALKVHVDQLADVFTDIFNMSVTPTCFKETVTVPVQNSLSERIPLQFAYRPNRSADDTISLALHAAFSDLDQRDIYVRMLFIDYSLAFMMTRPTERSES